MKLTIARSELLDALTIVSKGTSARSTLPILSGMLASCENGNLTLQATDLEISLKHTVPALTDRDGRTVFPGRLLTDIVRSLPEAAVTIEVENDEALVRCQQAAFTLKTLNAGDFPAFPEIAASERISLPTELMTGMVRKVARAVSRDETRAILTGVLLVIEGAVVRMVATDSYRLAYDEALLESPAPQDIEAVIPGRPLEEVSKIAAAGQQVELGVSENQVVFVSGDTTFVARRIEGTFPNFRQLMSSRTGDETVVTVPTEEFAAAVKRVSLLAIHNTPLRVAVNIEDQTMSLLATTQDVGDASEDLMVKAEGKDVEIAFNHAYLSDGLGAVSTETVELQITSPLKPGLLEAGEGGAFRYLLMPVRLS